MNLERKQFKHAAAKNFGFVALEWDAQESKYVRTMEPDGGFGLKYECAKCGHKYSLRSTGMMFLHSIQIHAERYDND